MTSSVAHHLPLSICHRLSLPLPLHTFNMWFLYCILIVCWQMTSRTSLLCAPVCVVVCVFGIILLTQAELENIFLECCDMCFYAPVSSQECMFACNVRPCINTDLPSQRWSSAGIGGLVVVEHALWDSCSPPPPSVSQLTGEVMHGRVCCGEGRGVVVLMIVFVLL